VYNNLNIVDSGKKTKTRELSYTWPGFTPSRLSKLRGTSRRGVRIYQGSYHRARVRLVYATLTQRHPINKRNAWVGVYTCEHPPVASGDSLVPKIQHNHQGRACTSIVSSEQRLGKTDYTPRANPPLEHLNGCLTLHVLPTPPRCMKYLCTPYSDELRLSMGLANSPQLSVSTQCKTKHTRRHREGTRKQVQGTRAKGARASTARARRHATSV